MNTPTPELFQLAEKTFTEGSKTFSLAAGFFPQKMMVMASLIYLWCRYSDDLFDEYHGDAEALVKLNLETSDVWLHPERVKDAPFLALLEVKNEVNLPMVYPLELLKGMEMDLRGEVYENFNSLKLYCYRVASTVGLMMCHVMGLFHIGALKEAAELGMAMQLTNIARDVKADHDLGRTYLPLDWLRSAGLDQENYFLKENRRTLFLVVKKLIGESEELYRSGLRGIHELPIISAFTVLVAAKIYRQIGRDILKKGAKALEARVRVSLPMKLWLIGSSFFEVLLQIPFRLVRRKNLIKINETWIYA